MATLLGLFLGVVSCSSVCGRTQEGCTNGQTFRIEHATLEARHNATSLDPCYAPLATYIRAIQTLTYFAGAALSPSSRPSTIDLSGCRQPRAQRACRSSRMGCLLLAARTSLFPFGIKTERAWVILGLRGLVQYTTRCVVRMHVGSCRPRSKCWLVARCGF